MLAERRRVGARLELGEAVDEAVRLRVDDLELLLDREGEILRAVEDSARLVERRKRVRDAQAHRRERTSAIASTSRGRNLPIPQAWSDRDGSYFLLLALAGVFGWSVGLWAVPIVAFVVLETVWTVAEWTRERGARTLAASALREVEVERVQELDGRARAVHDHVRGRLQERLGVVEDDVHAGLHELIGDALGGARRARR